MKLTTKTLLTCTAAAACAVSAQAAPLLFDSFDDDKIATATVTGTNGGFEKVVNADGGTVTEAGGAVTITSEGHPQTTGIRNLNAVDLTGGFTATFDVASASGLNSNGIVFIIGTDHAADGWRIRPSFYLKLDKTASEFQVYAWGASGLGTALSTAGFIMSEVENGFTLNFSADDSGWSYSFTGLASVSDASGDYTGGASDVDSFTELVDTTSFVGFYVQSGTADLNQIAINPIPEPGSLALLGLGGLLIARRRRA